MKNRILISLLFFMFVAQALLARPGKFKSCSQRFMLEGLYESAPGFEVFGGGESVVSGKFEMHDFLGKGEIDWFNRHPELKKKYGSAEKFLRVILSDTSDESVRVDFGQSLSVKILHAQNVIVSMLGDQVTGVAFLDPSLSHKNKYRASIVDYVEKVLGLRVLDPSTRIYMPNKLGFIGRDVHDARFNSFKNGLGITTRNAYIESARYSLKKRGSNILRFMLRRQPGNIPVVVVLDLESKKVTVTGYREKSDQSILLTHFKASDETSFLSLLFESAGRDVPAQQ